MESKSQHILTLSEELLADLELSRLPAEQLLLKVTRLARLAGRSKIQKWLEFEMMGYNGTDPVSLEFMNLTNRWIDPGVKSAYYGPLAQQEAEISAFQLRLQGLRIPDVTYSPSSSNPQEYVTPFVKAGVAAPINSVLVQAQTIQKSLSQIASIKSRVLALLHQFVSSVYYEKLFSVSTIIGKRSFLNNGRG